LNDGDWRDWIISRARSSIRVGGGTATLVHLRDSSTHAPLVASVPMEKGILTAVALDLLPQLQIVHPGGYRLLANLVSY
jgi:hypothetical protein